MKKNTYHDVILTHVELVPYKYKGRNQFNKVTTYKAYPESLTVSCTFPSKVEYCTSSPKSQSVSSKYSLGVAVEGKTVGVSGGMEIEEPALTIKNQSSEGSNMYKLFYDFDPGLTGYSDKLEDYLQTTTEHIGYTSVNSSSKNYSFTMKFVTNTGYTWGIYI